MANVKVVGNAIVITSALKFEDILKVQKYRPSALILKGGEDGKQPIFKVEARAGATGSINEFGATFGSATHTDEGLATITLCIEAPAGTSGDDIKSLIADKYGVALANLKQLEEALPGVLTTVTTERTALMNTITVE